MGKVLIRFYEELNDYLPAGKRKRDFEVPLSGNETAREIIEKLGVRPEQVDLLLVNGRSAALEKVVNEGDRISVYPVFESMNIEGVSRIREKPLRRLRFMADRDLGALAESLKALGLDVCLRGGPGREQTVQGVKEERRILLTRQPSLAGSHGRDRVIVLRSESLHEQVDQVLDALDLRGDPNQEAAQ
jgi:sulfur carrier protein ThiS